MAVQGPIPLDQQFKNFAKYTIKTGKEPPIEVKPEDKKKEVKTITLRQIDFWFEQSKLFDRYLTRTDTGLTYIAFKTGCIEYSEFLIFLNNVAEKKDMDVDEMKNKLMSCGLPGVEPKKKPEAEKEKKEL